MPSHVKACRKSQCTKPIHLRERAGVAMIFLSLPPPPFFFLFVSPTAVSGPIYIETIFTYTNFQNKTQNHAAGDPNSDKNFGLERRYFRSALETFSPLFPTTANMGAASDVSGEEYICKAEWKPSVWASIWNSKAVSKPSMTKTCVFREVGRLCINLKINMGSGSECTVGRSDIIW